MLAAHRDGEPASIRVGNVEQLVAPAIAGLPAAEILARGSDFARWYKVWLLVLPLERSPFSLVYMVPDASLRALLIPRFGPYALILVGLLLTLGLVFSVLRRQLIAPGLALVRHIQAEAGGKRGALSGDRRRPDRGGRPL